MISGPASNSPGMCCCCLCLLLNVYACWSWRKEKFVAEKQCYQGLAEKHLLMVVNFMEGVLGGIVEVAEKASSEEVAEEAAGGDARESEKKKAKGKRRERGSTRKRWKIGADSERERVVLNSPQMALIRGLPPLADCLRGLSWRVILPFYSLEVRILTLSIGRTQAKYTILRTRWSKHSVTISASLRIGVPWITDDHSSRRFQKRRRHGWKYPESPLANYLNLSETRPFSCYGRGKISFATNLRLGQRQI
jgi:hypothetical protein